MNVKNQDNLEKKYDPRGVRMVEAQELGGTEIENLDSQRSGVRELGSQGIWDLISSGARGGLMRPRTRETQDELRSLGTRRLDA